MARLLTCLVAMLALSSIAYAYEAPGLYGPARLEPSAEMSDPPPTERVMAEESGEEDSQEEDTEEDEPQGAESDGVEAADGSENTSVDAGGDDLRAREGEAAGPERMRVEPVTPPPPPPPPMRTTTGRAIEAVDVAQFVERLDSDRRLLSELRKEVPEALTEAESYLVRLKSLSESSDPVRLVPLANRVLAQAPIYFAWLGREFEDADERTMEYYVGGARGFNIALETFKDAVMFTIIQRLDVAAKLIPELDYGVENK